MAEVISESEFVCKCFTCGSQIKFSLDEPKFNSYTYDWSLECPACNRDITIANCKDTPDFISKVRMEFEPFPFWKMRQS